MTKISKLTIMLFVLILPVCLFGCSLFGGDDGGNGSNSGSNAGVTAIKLNIAYYEMEVGEEMLILNQVLQGEQDVTRDVTLAWSSSNKNVATVHNDGVVTAVAVGSTTITAKAGSKSATCEITVVAGGTYAGEEVLTYTSMDNVVKITGLTNSSVTKLKIPSRINNMEVNQIGSSAFRDANIQSVKIPDTITQIGANAFYFCTSLDTVIIPDSVRFVDEWAFVYCENLKQVSIGSNVSELGEKVFYGCKKIQTMFVNKYNTHYDSRNNCNAIIETSTNTLLFGCKNTTIPSSVQTIGDYAFIYNTNLTSITIPSNVTTIKDHAFYGCTHLAQINLKEGLTTIATEAFSYISATKIIMPISLVYVENNVFYGCENLKVYCRVASKPSNWYTYWNAGVQDTIWGYTGN